MIDFELSRWRNLLSTGNNFTEVKLNGWPSVLIIGRNGSGKSTMLDVITFVLFGKPFREIKKGQFINSINGKNGEGQVEFSKGTKKYKVVRGIKPDTFEIWENGVLLNKRSDSRDYQAYLEDHILGFNIKTFKQIVIAGKASYVPFMKLKAGDRRLFIEDLLDIQIFAVLAKLVKSRLDASKSAIEKNKLERVALDTKKQMVERNIKIAEGTTEDAIAKLTDEIKTALTKVTVLESNMRIGLDVAGKILAETPDVSKATTKLHKMIGLKSQIEANRKNNANHYNFFHDNDACPTCKQVIQEDFKTDEVCRLEHKDREFADALLQLDDQIKETQEQIDHHAKLRNDWQSLDRQLVVTKSEIQEWKRIIDKNGREITNLQQRNIVLSSHQDDLKQVDIDLILNEQQFQELDEQRLYDQTAADMLKDGGIKTKIIKQYLPLINTTVNKYLKQMGFLVKFELDESFNETIKARYLDDYSYENFSEGEKMRIDLALLFTWRVVAKAKNSANTNLLILDEVFDASLDNEGIEDLLKILGGFTKDTNTFIISQRQDQLVDKFKKVFKATKKKNFSVLTEV